MCLFGLNDRQKGIIVLSTNWVLSSVQLYCDLRDTGYIIVTEAQRTNVRMREKDKH